MKWRQRFSWILFSTITWSLLWSFHLLIHFFLCFFFLLFFLIKKVGDFGLARLQPDRDSGVETRIIGTFGYLAPEYAQSGQVSEKADVYSFGVVLVELVTGRKAVDIYRPKGEQCLTEWVGMKKSIYMLLLICVHKLSPNLVPIGRGEEERALRSKLMLLKFSSWMIYY